MSPRETDTKYPADHFHFVSQGYLEQVDPEPLESLDLRLDTTDDDAREYVRFLNL